MERLKILLIYVLLDLPIQKVKNVLVGVLDFSFLNSSLNLSDLKRLEDSKINAILHMKGFQLLDSNTNSILSNRLAYNYSYTYLDSNIGTLRAMEIGTIANNKVYYIQYFSEPSRYYELLPTVLGMIKSFVVNS